MRTLLLSCAVLLCSAALHGQQVLAYSQTLLVTSSSGTLTVPAGRVWKLQNVLYSSSLPDPVCTGSTTCTSMVPHNDAIVVNGTTTNIRSMRSRGTASGGSGTTTVVWEQSFPIWLTSGNTLATGTGVLGISVIEFIQN